MLRYSADWRTVAYLIVAAALPIIQWNLPTFHPSLYVATLALFIAVAVISHNHNHLAMWKRRPLNLFTSYLISLHYGHPAIAWVPTHNQNHHKFNNKEGDTGRSPGLFKGNHLLSLLTYPMYTGVFRQQADIKKFFKDLWKRDRRAFWLAASEYAVFFGLMAVLGVINWRKALIFYVIPQQTAIFAIQVFNYVQHVEANEQSPWNHSRNFVSPLLNTLLFNNGYHTVHHHKPGVHWSQTPALHFQVEKNIHPELLQKSLFVYLGKTFFWRPLAGAKAPELPEMTVSPGSDQSSLAA